MHKPAAVVEKEEGLALSGPVTLTSVRPLIGASELIVERAKGAGFSVDWSDVGEVDSAALALLLGWRRRLDAKQIPLTHHNFPPALTVLAELYGLKGAL